MKKIRIQYKVKDRIFFMDEKSKNIYHGINRLTFQRRILINHIDLDFENSLEVE